MNWKSWQYALHRAFELSNFTAGTPLPRETATAVTEGLKRVADLPATTLVSEEDVKNKVVLPMLERWVMTIPTSITSGELGAGTLM